VVGLRERAYAAILDAYGLDSGNFRTAVEDRVPVPLTDGVAAFAVYHCGARILNTHRKLENQLDDWKRIATFLDAGSF
jgi:hypothetical protein